MEYWNEVFGTSRRIYSNVLIVGGSHLYLNNLIVRETGCDSITNKKRTLLYERVTYEMAVSLIRQLMKLRRVWRRVKS